MRFGILCLGVCFCFGVREFGLGGGIVSGERVSDDTEIFPCAGSLPMGFSWSLYYCQLIVEARLGSLDLFAGSRLLNDRGGSPVLDVEELQRAGRAPKSNWEPPSLSLCLSR